MQGVLVNSGPRWCMGMICDQAPLEQSQPLAGTHRLADPARQEGRHPPWRPCLPQRCPPAALPPMTPVQCHVHVAFTHAMDEHNHAVWCTVPMVCNFNMMTCPSEKGKGSNDLWELVEHKLKKLLTWTSPAWSVSRCTSLLPFALYSTSTLPLVSYSAICSAPIFATASATSFILLPNRLPRTCEQCESL